MANLQSLKEAAGKAAAVRKEMEARIKELEAQIAQEKEVALSQVNEGMEEFQDEWLLIAGLAPEGMTLLIAPRPADGAMVPMFVPIKAAIPATSKKSSTKSSTGSGYADKKKEYTVTVEGTVIPDITTAGAIRRLAMAQEELDEEGYCESYNEAGGKCDASKGLGNFPGWALNGKEIPMLEGWGIVCEIKDAVPAVTTIVPVKAEDKPVEEAKAEETKSEEPVLTPISRAFVPPTDVPEVAAVPATGPGSVMELAMALTGKAAGTEKKPKEAKPKKS